MAVDGHRGGHPVERDAGQEPPHVVDRVDRHPHPPDLAAGHRIVGVVADLGGEVEGHRQPGRPLLEQVAVAAVGLRGAGVAGVLAHGPQAPAVHVRVETAGEREVAGIADRRRVVEAGDVVRPIGGADGDAGGGRPLLLGRFALGRRRHPLRSPWSRWSRRDYRAWPAGLGGAEPGSARFPPARRTSPAGALTPAVHAPEACSSVPRCGARKTRAGYLLPSPMARLRRADTCLCCVTRRHLLTPAVGDKGFSGEAKRDLDSGCRARSKVHHILW